MLRTRAGKDQKGVAMVEVALILPVVLVILFAIFEFGLAFWRKQELTAAVRDGARYGTIKVSTKPTKSQIEDKVKTYLKGLGWNTSAVTASATGAQGASGTDLTVSATYPTTFLILSKFQYGGDVGDGSGNVTLKAKVTMQHE